MIAFSVVNLVTQRCGGGPCSAHKPTAPPLTCAHTAGRRCPVPAHMWASTTLLTARAASPPASLPIATSTSARCTYTASAKRACCVAGPRGQRQRNPDRLLPPPLLLPLLLLERHGLALLAACHQLRHHAAAAGGVMRAPSHPHPHAAAGQTGRHCPQPCCSRGAAWAPTIRHHAGLAARPPAPAPRPCREDLGFLNPKPLPRGLAGTAAAAAPAAGPAAPSCSPGAAAGTAPWPPLLRH